MAGVGILVGKQENEILKIGPKGSQNPSGLTKKITTHKTPNAKLDSNLRYNSPHYHAQLD